MYSYKVSWPWEGQNHVFYIGFVSLKASNTMVFYKAFLAMSQAKTMYFINGFGAPWRSTEKPIYFSKSPGIESQNHV